MRDLAGAVKQLTGENAVFAGRDFLDEDRLFGNLRYRPSVAHSVDAGPGNRKQQTPFLGTSGFLTQETFQYLRKVHDRFAPSGFCFECRCRICHILVAPDRPQGDHCDGKPLHCVYSHSPSLRKG